MGLPWKGVGEQGEPDYVPNVSNWKPFVLDALGLVTLLGAEEVNAAIGRLVPSRYLEYFPLLGAFVIAGDRFKEKSPSFHLYNISQGIETPDLACWLSRWLLAQEFSNQRCIVDFTIDDRGPPHRAVWRAFSAFLAFICLAPILVLAVASGDWYGMANVISMSLSIVVRAYVVQANRSAIDREINLAEGNPQSKTDFKKCLIIMSDSTAVTLTMQDHLMRPVFVFNPEPSQPEIYNLVRYIGWLAFGVHIISIGNSTLAVQLPTIAVMIIPTALICWKLGCDDSKWMFKLRKGWARIRGKPLPLPGGYECWFGTKLKATVSEWPEEFEFTDDSDKAAGDGFSWPIQGDEPPLQEPITWYPKILDGKREKTKRQDLYAWLDMDKEELESMGKWDLIPHDRPANRAWMSNYQAKLQVVESEYLRGRNPVTNRCRPVDAKKAPLLHGSQTVTAGGMISIDASQPPQTPTVRQPTSPSLLSRRSSAQPTGDVKAGLASTSPVSPKDMGKLLSPVVEKSNSSCDTTS